MSQPTAQGNVYGGTSTSEQEALLASANRVNMSVPDVNDPRPVVLASGTANVVFFQGNTRLAPFNGTADTVTRGSTTYAGSGGPVGLRLGNTNVDDIGPAYQGYITAYNLSGAHTGNRQMRVALRGATGSGDGSLTTAQINALRQRILLATDVEYRVIVWPHTQAIASGGKALPAPENLAGCFIYRVNATDAAHAEINYYGGRNAAGTADDVNNQSPFIPLILVSSPTLAGYSTFVETPAAGDLVFIVDYELQDLDGDGTPEADVYMLEDQRGDVHELTYTGTRGAAGDRGIWYPYVSLQSASGLCNASQLVSIDAPFPSARDKTEQNWYLTPSVTLPPNTWTNGQTVTFRTTGNLAWGSATLGIVLLMFFSNAEKNGWDPWLHESAGWTGQVAHWFEKGPYQTFTNATYTEATKTLTKAGSGLGDLGAACLWITGGTGADIEPVLIDNDPVTGSSGDDLILLTSIGASANGETNISGFVGGLLTTGGTVGTEKWVSGKLNNNGAVGPVLILQSDAVASAGAVNFSIEVKITHISQPLGDGGNGFHAFNVEAQFTIGGTSGTGGSGSTVSRTFRSCSHSVMRDIVNLFTEHLGITVLMRAVEGTSGTGDIAIPGVHGWYPRSPYNPKNGMGWPLRFNSSNVYQTVATASTENAVLLRPREWEFIYNGSQNK
jgi:hypothetical protein